MKKLPLIVMFIMLVLFGRTTAYQANAQVYLYYDPFEVADPVVADPDIEPMEEDGPQILLTTSQAIWVSAIMTTVLFVLALKFFRIRKNKQNRARMEQMSKWMEHSSAHRAFAAMVLLLLIASPIRAQVFLDEKSREENRLSKIQSELPVKPKLPSSKDGYTPLGSGILVFSALGGAYLAGKRARNQKKQ